MVNAISPGGICSKFGEASATPVTPAAHLHGACRYRSSPTLGRYEIPQRRRANRRTSLRQFRAELIRRQHFERMLQRIDPGLLHNHVGCGLCGRTLTIIVIKAAETTGQVTVVSTNWPLLCSNFTPETRVSRILNSESPGRSGYAHSEEES